MNHDDPEVLAVRRIATELAGPMADPTPAAVARTWSRVGAGRSDSRRRWRPSLRGVAVPHWVAVPGWVAVPASAAAVVVVALVAATVFRPTPKPTTDVAVPARPIESSSTKIPPRPAPTANIPDHGKVVRSVSLSQAVNAMVAASASAVPLVFAPGQLLYSRTELAELGPKSRWKTHVYEMWSDPNGMTALRIVHDGIDFGAGSEATPDPNLGYPNPHWLATLTTNPAKLFAMFAALNDGVKLGGQHYVSKEVFYAFRTYGPILRPAQRAAFFRVLSLISGGTANQITVAGHTYYGIRDMTSSLGVAGDLLCDPATGQVVGERYGDGDIELWHYAVVNEVGQTG